MDALEAACNDDNRPGTLDARAKKVLQLMREQGVEPTPTEDATFVLKWVRNSIPVEVQPLPCVDEFAIYAGMRETVTMNGP